MADFEWVNTINKNGTYNFPPKNTEVIGLFTDQFESPMNYVVVKHYMFEYQNISCWYYNINDIETIRIHDESIVKWSYIPDSGDL